MRRVLFRCSFAAAVAAAALLAGAQAGPAPREPAPRGPAAGEGTVGERVLFLSDFEQWGLRVEQLPVSAFGWEQDFSSLDRPRAMAATVVETDRTTGSRVLRFPAGGGRALLHSRRLPEPGLDPTHPPAMPGERLVVEARVRWDDLGSGRWSLGVRFARDRDPVTGLPSFGSGEAGVVPLLAGGGAAEGWSLERAEAIVPVGAVGWRLEFRVDASREHLPGGLEIDDVRVIATPRAIVRWRDPLRRIEGELEHPVEIESVGLPAGDYEVDLAVIDGRGEILAAEQLPRYVDESHPIQLRPTARFLATAEGDGSSGGAAGSRAEIRRLVLLVRGADGREWIRREEPFALGVTPFEAGRGRSRHGFEVSLDPPAWVEPLSPVPVLVLVDAATLAAAAAAQPAERPPPPSGRRAARPRGRASDAGKAAIEWPRALAMVPETHRAARVSLGERDLVRSRAALAALFAAVPRWYLEGTLEAPGIAARLAGEEPDLRFGIVAPTVVADPEFPLLFTVAGAPPAGAPSRFAARLDGAALGGDPEVWAAALFRLDAAGATEVYLIDPIGTLFRARRSPEEGYAPQPAWLAWSAARGFLGGARAIARERWLPGVDTLLYARGERDAVAFIAEGPDFTPATIDLRVDSAPRAFDAIGREIALPPAEQGRITVEYFGRFLLIEGVDLALERTARSLAIVAEAGGFSLQVENYLGGRASIEPSLELPPGYELRGALLPLTVEAGARARWDLVIEAPPTAGIEGTELTRGVLALTRPDGRSERVPFERPLPLECSRLEISLSDVRAERATVRIANRETAPVSFHLHLQAGPDGRGERTFTGQRLLVGESRIYELPFAGEPRSGGDLWVGVTFTDGDRGYFNRTFPLP